MMQNTLKRVGRTSIEEFVNTFVTHSPELTECVSSTHVLNN